MTKRGPKVSILIPTYNQEAFLADCIESALQQTYENLEIVISDDASTDRTGEVARRFLADRRVRYHRNVENIGRVANYRSLLNVLASGDWVLMLDGDDYLINRRYVANAMSLALSTPDIVLVFGKLWQGQDVSTATLCNTGARVQAVWEGIRFFLEHPPFSSLHPLHMTCLFRRPAAINADCYRHDILSSDFESFYRLMLGHKIAFLDEVAGLWRQHANNTSRTAGHLALVRNFRAFVGPYKYARSLGILSRSELKRWLHGCIARYYRGCFDRLWAADRRWDALRLTVRVLMIDMGTMRDPGVRASLSRLLGVSGRRH